MLAGWVEQDVAGATIRARQYVEIRDTHVTGAITFADAPSFATELKCLKPWS